MAGRSRHDTFSVYDDARGSGDNQIIQQALKEDRILITNDKDFGEKVFRENWPHHGVILMRLDNELSANKIRILEQLLASYADRLHDQFVVVTETKDEDRLFNKGIFRPILGDDLDQLRFAMVRRRLEGHVLFHKIRGRIEYLRLPARLPILLSYMTTQGEHLIQRSVKLDRVHFRYSFCCKG